MKTQFRRMAVAILFCLSFFCGKVCAQVEVGASRTELYFPILKDKTIAVVSNQTGEFAGTL